MKKLKTAVRVTEVDGISDTILRLYEDDADAKKDGFLPGLMAELGGLSAQITEAILQDKTLSTLDAADSTRDEAVKTLGTLLSAYTVFPVAAKRELAGPLQAVYEKYSKAGITSENYTSESSMIESMLSDFAAAGLAAGIAGLDGISEALAAIRTAQDEFTAANDAYIKASANKSASASSYKKPIVSLINDRLVPYLDAMVIAGSSNCIPFAKNVETEIVRANGMVDKRGKKPDSES